MIGWERIFAGVTLKGAILKIDVVGGGIYGCHIANSFLELGHNVTLYEKQGTIFGSASGNNQFRLHQGFHYPRNAETRRQSVSGFDMFKKQYGHYAKGISENLYAVVRNKSITDFETYKLIMKTDGLVFSIVDAEYLNETMIEGLIKTNEEYLDIDGLRSFFEVKLEPIIELGSNYNFEKYSSSVDLVIDCTWGSRNETGEYYFEPTILFYYENLNSRWKDWSLTLMDGDFWSLYKTGREGIVTLSHVAFSVLGRYQTQIEAQARLKSLSEQEIELIREKIEVDVLACFPSFLNDFNYVSPQYSIKTKPNSNSASRACEVKLKSNIATVMSGKLDTIFHAEKELLSIMAQLKS